MVLSRLTAIILIIAFALIILRQGESLPQLKIGNAEIKLERLETAAEQERGLSYRQSLPEDGGVLFVYQDDNAPSFWMKGMNFPLDIIWLDRNLTVVGFEKNVSPSTYPRTFSPPAPIRYVLEVNAGFVDKHQLKIGDKAYN